MSEQRLSKLQKWILENCFKVTVLSDRTMLKELNHITRGYKCRACNKLKESVRLSRDNNKLIVNICRDDGFPCPYFNFYKEDVLLSFFLLTPNNGIAHINRTQHFHDSPDYTKAHVTAHRSINSLAEKGFIYAFNVFREYSVQIYLSDKGIEKAAELLKIYDYISLLGS